MTITKQNIDEFYQTKNIAVVGASAKKRKFGNDVITELTQRNYNVFVLHPEAEMIEGFKCFRSVADLPEEVGAIHISVNKNKTNKIVSEAKQKGIKNIWVQQMSENAETLSFAEDCNLITGQCVLMHLEPVKGVHKFHRSIKKFFGKLPK
jgi:predicted CoA-binding protein